MTSNKKFVTIILFLAYLSLIFFSGIIFVRDGNSTSAAVLAQLALQLQILQTISGFVVIGLFAALISDME
ncbi:MAG: hypothetical protein RTV31_11020 [Candidatus Thorarchaeota archaeon]